MKCCNARLIWLLMILTALGQPLLGQTIKPRTAKGRVTDQRTGQPIPFASVAAYSLPDTTLVTGTITNTKGDYELPRLPGNTLLLKAGFVGYRTSVVTLMQSDNQGKDLVLIPTPTTLEGVEINATATGKQTNIEKTRISMEGNLSASTGSIAQVLMNQPNITLDNDQNVSIRGNKNVLLLVDGVPTT
ncbi:MAG: carboxypeptidase-like regulatory domain-containing protein, partial [Bacteroidales bacterium]|nr:carboxypeptidase-like regulatory domain-containing protein [Bacteroidales bacterium]